MEDTVTLTFLRIGNDTPEADYWKSLIKEFEAKNQNIKIQYDDAAIGEPMETKLTHFLQQIRVLTLSDMVLFQWQIGLKQDIISLLPVTFPIGKATILWKV